MRPRVVVILIAAAGLCAVCFGQAADKPAAEAAGKPAIHRPPKPLVVPRQWEFQVELDQLRCVPVRLAGEQTDRLFWYLRYTVTNLGRTDQVFVPELVLYTSTGELSRAGRKVPTVVFDKIKKLHGDPLLKTQTSVTRKILHGKDNAKSGAAIWPDFDRQSGTIDIFIGGLSGETKAIDLPAPVKVVETDWRGTRQTVVKKRLILAKTLHVRYAIPGEKGSRRASTPRLIKKEWVMR